MRLTFFCVLFVACGNSHSPSDDVDSGVDELVPPDGGALGEEGVCCPVDSFRGCSPEGIAAGGWAPSMAECTRSLTYSDGCPVAERVDDRGCAEIYDPGFSCPEEDRCGVLPSPSCPDVPPEDGAPCEGALGCTYFECDDRGLVGAGCDGGSWTIQTEECEEVLCDGAGTCPAGQI